VLTPNLDHRGRWLQSLIKHADCTVAKAGHKDVPSYLVGSKGRNARA
jgi:hypothetical protein